LLGDGVLLADGVLLGDRFHASSTDASLKGDDTNAMNAELDNGDTNYDY
jgi:hypothetical protein